MDKQTAGSIDGWINNGWIKRSVDKSANRYRDRQIDTVDRLGKKDRSTDK